MSETYKFIVEGDKYEILKDLIKEGTYLYTLINTSVGSSSVKGDEYILDSCITKEMFEIVINYFNSKKFPYAEDLDILDYFAVPYKVEYQLKIKRNIERFESTYRKSKLKLHDIIFGKECEYDRSGDCVIGDDKLSILKYYSGKKCNVYSCYKHIENGKDSKFSGVYYQTKLNMTSLVEQDTCCCDDLDLVPIWRHRDGGLKGGLVYTKFKKNPIFIEVMEVNFHMNWGGFQCHIEARPSKRSIRNLQALIVPLIKPKIGTLDPIIKKAHGLYTEDMSPKISYPLMKSDRLKSAIKYFFRR
jgi:hypothetical protein